MGEPRYFSSGDIHLRNGISHVMAGAQRANAKHRASDKMTSPRVRGSGFSAYDFPSNVFLVAIAMEFFLWLLDSLHFYENFGPASH